MSGFSPGEKQWVARLGNLRNAIRQEMIRRQLGDHVASGMSVLDVGCGQGTQAIGLARLGCAVTGVEPSAELRALCNESASAAGVEVSLIAGSLEALDALLGQRRFDLVCAHGLLMYLDDRAGAISILARRVTPGGLLSITFRNGHALAFRPAMRRDWAASNRAFEGRSYMNELGVMATADLLEEVQLDLATVGLKTKAWYGVRVFNDAVSVEMDMPADEDLEALLDAEEQAGRRDPYRWMASQFHVVAQAAR